MMKAEKQVPCLPGAPSAKQRTTAGVVCGLASRMLSDHYNLDAGLRVPSHLCVHIVRSAVPPNLTPSA